MSQLYDISVTLGVESADWPGDPAYEQFLAKRVEVDGGNLTRLSLGAHSGTHIDAPAHFLPDGDWLSAFDLRRFILPATVIDATGRQVVTSADLDAAQVGQGEALLVRTDHSAGGGVRAGRFHRDFPYFDASAAQWCVQRHLGLVGLDSPSVDGFSVPNQPAHRPLLAAGILILESADLTDISPGRYELICLPLKLAGAEASPVRAVLRDAAS